ncbi:MAG: hypothetical protein IK080_09200 [Clostridia bacterium]|nr:hypothetical protein [Clostridia bacterium]
MRNIINIINFVRNCEPREDDDSYLFPTLCEELKLCDNYGFRSTVLFQYDALIEPRYIDLARAHADRCEYGLWLEITEPHCQDAGLPWRGRYPWDWENNVNYLHGYLPEERKRLIDTAFEKFREIYGAYPAVFGCWTIDAVSYRYIETRYPVVAACICRDQYGTDANTMWGGYYNGGYYPCFGNMLCPASGPEEQMKTPVFRMLGPDPLRQYDWGLGDPEVCQQVSTMEPVYTEGGGSRKFVEWYFRESFNGKCLSHAYAQLGQENSFGWKSIKNGLPMQFEILDRAIKDGRVELMTLGETGMWFAETFRETPPAAICVDSDYEKDGYRTVWYSCKNYRMNILYQDGRAWIRDFQLFDGNFKEKCLEKAEDLRDYAIFNLPVMDGFRFSKDEIRAGVYVCKDGEVVTGKEAFLTETQERRQSAAAELPGTVRFEMYENRIEITLADPESYLAFVYSPACKVPYSEVEEKTLFMKFRGRLDSDYSYSVRLASGRFAQTDGTIRVLPEAGRITFEVAPLCL